MTRNAKANDSRQIALAFDGEATRYREAYEVPLPAAEMRAATHRLYARYLKQGDRILDLNCGPGPDFEFFRMLGGVISGVDLSPEMLKIAQTRAPHAVLHCLDFNEMDKIGGTFEAICSNFGGLNTQSVFGEFASKCHEKLVPGGFFLCNIMTPFPLPEILEGIWGRRHWLRRIRQPDHGIVKVGGSHLKVHYFWPGKFYRQFFKPYFDLVEIQGLGVFLPPPYLAQKKESLPGWSLFLEKCLAHRFPFKYWGDHTMLVMRGK